MAEGSVGEAILKSEKGFTLWQSPNDNNPEQEGAFNASVYDDLTLVNCYIFKKDILKAKYHAEQLLENFTNSMIAEPGLTIEFKMLNS